MKKILLLTAMVLTFNILLGQGTRTDIPFYNWTENDAYIRSLSPIITGYGEYSDSLSKVFDGVTFYEHNEEYYPIESWADYYYWYVLKYPFRFEDPQLYVYYYWAKDDFGMASYIASAKYLGHHYPSYITVSFADRTVEINRLNGKYLADLSEEEITGMKEEHERLNELKYENVPKEEENEGHKPDFTKPNVFQKDDFRNTKLNDNKFQNANNQKIEVKETKIKSKANKSEK